MRLKSAVLTAISALVLSAPMLSATEIYTYNAPTFSGLPATEFTLTEPGFITSNEDIFPGNAALDIINEKTGEIYVESGQEITEVHDGDVIRLGSYEWTAVATPGHDAHLLCYHERRTGMFVYSDLLSTRGTAIPWYAPGGGGKRERSRQGERLGQCAL